MRVKLTMTPVCVNNHNPVLYTSCCLLHSKHKLQTCQISRDAPDLAPAPSCGI